MSELLTLQDLANGHLDVKALGEAANGDENTIVTTRTGNTYPSAERAINIMFQNGGLPAVPFATKTLMTASSLANDKYAMVTDDTDNNGLYVKTAGEWVKSAYDSTEQANKYTREQIKIQDSRYLDESINLYNHANSEIGIVISATGVVDTNSGYAVSEYLSVDAGEKYYYTSAVRENFFAMACYDADKVFLKRVDMKTAMDKDISSITIPAGTSYVRFNIKLLSLDLDRMIFTDVALTEDNITPFRKTVLKNVSLSEGLQKEVTGIVRPLTYNPNLLLTNHVELPKNLFNKDDVVLKKVVSATGEVVDHSASSFLSNYIAVEPNTKYTIATKAGTNVPSGGIFTNIAYYTLDKIFISRPALSKVESATITTPSNAAYVRLMSNYRTTDYERSFMLGDGVAHSESNTAKIRKVDFSQDVLDGIKDKYKYDTDLNTVFVTDKDYTKYAYIASSPSADVYAAWDALMAANPTYITKERLRDSVLGKEISAYTLTPPKFDSYLQYVGKEDKYPTVFMGCTIHGHEAVPVFSSFALASEMCNEWKTDETMGALRFNSRFIIIPICNPDGWVHNPEEGGLVQGRKNANKIDLARNFPTIDWISDSDPDSSTYGGVTPASEPETLNIMQIINDNDVDIFYDFHNFKTNKLSGGGYATQVWVVTSNYADMERTARSGRQLFSRLTRTMNKRFDNIPLGWQAGYSSGISQGLPVNYASEQGCTIACTFEINRLIPSFGSDVVTHQEYDLEHGRICVEALVNWLLISLCEVALAQ